MAFFRSNPAKEVLGSYIHGKPKRKQSRPQEPNIFQLPRINHWNNHALILTLRSSSPQKSLQQLSLKDAVNGVEL